MSGAISFVGIEPDDDDNDIFAGRSGDGLAITLALFIRNVAATYLGNSILQLCTRIHRRRPELFLTQILRFQIPRYCASVLQQKWYP